LLFLADENFPVEITNAIRQAEHDLAWVGDLSPGIADEGVVALAVETGRTILTFDKDFGNLTPAWSQHSSWSIIVSRSG
jgi:predicted nuclease of predicted toxin-antitoxin system